MSGIPVRVYPALVFVLAALLFLLSRPYQSLVTLIIAIPVLLVLTVVLLRDPLREVPSLGPRTWVFIATYGALLMSAITAWRLGASLIIVPLAASGAVLGALWYFVHRKSRWAVLCCRWLYSVLFMGVILGLFALPFVPEAWEFAVGPNDALAGGLCYLFLLAFTTLAAAYVREVFSGSVPKGEENVVSHDGQAPRHRSPLRPRRTYRHPA